MKNTIMIAFLFLVGAYLLWGYMSDNPQQVEVKVVKKVVISDEGLLSKPLSKTYVQTNNGVIKYETLASSSDPQLIEISGSVVDDKGNAVPDVSLLVNIDIQQSIKTDAKGLYRFQVDRSTMIGSDIKIRFIKHGYVYQSKTIANIKTDTKLAYRIDTALDRISGYAVSGYILDDTEKTGVADIRLSLYSKEQQRATRIVASNEQGYFSIPYVPPANDYAVKVVDTPSYTVEDYNLPNNITVNDAPISLTLLATRIEKDVGVLNLNIRDAYLLPLEDLTVTVSQAEKTLSEGLTDANGVVSFTDVPDGKLTVAIDSLGLRITGIERNLHDNTTITADVGYNDLVVNVLGKDGLPVVCQQASLFYSYSQDGYTVRSTTSLTYDENDVIYSSGLGDGARKLLLSGCAKHQGASVSLELGSAVETIRLAPKQ